MRFLFDQSTDRRLAPFLRQADNHDVSVVAVDYPPSLPDREVLAIAVRERRILVTEDRDFGELIFSERLPHAGVLFLRLPAVKTLDCHAPVAPAQAWELLWNWTLRSPF